MRKMRKLKKEVPLQQPEYIIGTELFRGTTYGPEKYLLEHKKPFRLMNAVEFSHYMDKIRKDKGFDVDSCTGNMPGRIVPIPSGTHLWEGCEIMAEMAVFQSKNMALKYVSLEKANSQPVSGSMYYLTLKALDSKAEREFLYRAKMWHQPWKNFQPQLSYFRKYRTCPKLENSTGGQKGRTGPILRNRKGKEKIESGNGRKSIFCANRGFLLFVKKTKYENPHLTYAQARKLASQMWQKFSPAEKSKSISEAESMFEKCGA